MQDAVVDPVTTTAGRGAAVEGPKLSLVCSSCGYGVAVTVPPERCPMCHRAAAWNHELWRPFTARKG